MTILFRRHVPIRTLIAIEATQARALAAPIRLAMLDLLSTRPMSIEELSEELPSHGFRKATNTLRHHLEILVKAGLAELALLEQARGAVLKYFAASARPLHYHVPDEDEEEFGLLVAQLEGTVSSALDELARTDAARVKRIADSIRPCPRCPPGHLSEFVLLSALHRAGVGYLRERHEVDAGITHPGPTGRPVRRAGRRAR